MKPLVIGSRGSKLALAQAESIRARLAVVNPRIEIRIEIIKTSGDVKTEPLAIIGGKGVFTKELEDALIDGRIDLAVHSLKDLPTILPPTLTLAAMCEREDPRDALVLKHGAGDKMSLSTLPAGAVVGTSSQRRLAQLKHLRSNVVVSDVRGNVDTRLCKLDEGQYDALLLAVAGLRRLGLAERISAIISPDQMLPAVGQGALGIETRVEDSEAIDFVAMLNHEPTRQACLAERALLRSLGGGCQLPIAGYGVVSDGQLRLDGLVADSEGRQIVRDRITGPSSAAERLGETLAERLQQQGAGELLAR